MTPLDKTITPMDKEMTPLEKKDKSLSFGFIFLLIVVLFFLNGVSPYEWLAQVVLVASK